jgi:Na+/H+ antiporter NhaD/arsenite permease-like protein
MTRILTIIFFLLGLVFANSQDISADVLAKPVSTSQNISKDLESTKTQAVTEEIVASQVGETSVQGSAPGDAQPHSVTKMEQHKEPKGGSHHGDHHAPHLDGTNLSLLWVIPFMGILLSIALFPLIAEHFWHHNYGKISLFWGVLFGVAFVVGQGWYMALFYFFEVYLLEFIPFIALLLALFTVAGGIRVKGDLVGTPGLNTFILFLGTALASWMGTTGAAMLLIRPLIRANSWRQSKTHVVVFFIFLVANIGGSLTPLGDPPLFLGFLKGVSFFWTTKAMFIPMVVASSILLVVFYLLDSYMYKKEKNKPEPNPDGIKISLEGKANLLLLPLVIGAVLVSSLKLGPAFTIHYVEVPLAMALQVLGLVLITMMSLKLTPLTSSARIGNGFTWEPILEVAKLFATIFITMVPAIAMLKAGVDGPLGVIVATVMDESGQFVNASFFWATGILSSFLDNAPTYVVFFETAGGDAAKLMGEYSETLLAISMGAVFMGANTYIGNAPNFMVKAIAEENKVKMPSFFGYMLWSGAILIPTFVVLTFIFF